MNEFKIVSLRNRSDLNLNASIYFSSKWNISKESYLKEINSYINKETEFGWYLCLKKNEIIGGVGVIENDFHDHKELSPNICALYVNKEYRNQGIAGKLLNKVIIDMKNKGISPIYLVTDLNNFYEKYGFKFLQMVNDEVENRPIKMYVHY